MSRCGCTAACSCLLEALDTQCMNVTITGSGSATAGDPYIVSVDPVFDPNVDNILSCGPAGMLATTDDLATFAISGPLTAPTVGTLRFRFPFGATIKGVSAAVNTAPTGATIILDINRNGVSIFPAAPKPTIAIGAFDTGVAEAIPDTTSIVSGQYLQVDIDQVGSVVAGSDLTVFIRYRQT